MNKKGHHLSTSEATRLLEYGIETPGDIVTAPQGSFGEKHGYDIKAICETVDARPAEIRAYFKGRLEPARTKEIQNEILRLGIAGG
jgi:hypothetical protein